METESLKARVEARIEELLEELRALPFEYDDETYTLWQSIHIQLNNFYDIRSRFLETREEPKDPSLEVLY